MLRANQTYPWSGVLCGLLFAFLLYPATAHPSVEAICEDSDGWVTTQVRSLNSDMVGAVFYDPETKLNDPDFNFYLAVADCRIGEIILTAKSLKYPEEERVWGISEMMRLNMASEGVQPDSLAEYEELLETVQIPFVRTQMTQEHCLCGHEDVS